MFNFMFLCFCFIAGAKYAACSPITDYEYRQDIDAWLRLHIVPAAWQDAALRCYIEGGILASPTTSSMAAAMTEMMSAHKLSTRAVFTGIYAHDVTGDFVTLDGVPLANISLEWAVNEPDNVDNSEDCLAMTGAGALADVSCASVHPYFCRKEVTQTVTEAVLVVNANKCGTRDNGYELEPLTGSCYKFHGCRSSWMQAYIVCQQEGGHLVIINSESEAEVLKKIIHQQLVEKLNCQDDVHFCHYVAIGIWKLGDAKWTTVDGDTLEEAGYGSWDSGEPNNRHGLEYCGSVHRSGKLNDISCFGKKYPYICESTPNTNLIH